MVDLFLQEAASGGGSTSRLAIAAFAVSLVALVISLWKGWLEFIRGRRSIRIVSAKRSYSLKDPDLEIAIHNNGGRKEVVTRVGLRDGWSPWRRVRKRAWWANEFSTPSDFLELEKDGVAVVCVRGGIWRGLWPDDNIGPRAQVFVETAAGNRHWSWVKQDVLMTAMHLAVVEARAELAKHEKGRRSRL